MNEAANATSVVRNTVLPWKPGEPLTPAVVASSRTRERCWVVIDGQVCDVTRFLDDHPGGASILLQYAGQDASTEFEIHHGPSVRNDLGEYVIGNLQGELGATAPENEFVVAQVLLNETESKDSRRMTLKLPEVSARLPLTPGGHYLFRLPDGTCIRPYSPVQCSDDGRVVHFIIKQYENGELSPALHALPVDGQVLIRGPLPCPFQFSPDLHEGLLLLAGGTGVAPMFALAVAAAQASRRAFLLVSDKTPEDILLSKDLQDLEEAYPDLVFVRRVFTRHPPGSGRRIDCQLVTEFFPAQEASESIASAPLLAQQTWAAAVCGPPAFNADIGNLMRGLGYKTVALGG